MSKDFTGSEHEVVPGALRGYRAWRYDQGLLQACNFDGFPWLPGRNEAVCARTPMNRLCDNPDCPSCRRCPGPTPVAECSCGFYAKHRPDNFDSRGYVIGVIKAYGKVILGTEGFRAQYAEIEALAPLTSLYPESLSQYKVPILTPGMMLERFPPISVKELLPPEPEVVVDTSFSKFSITLNQTLSPEQAKRMLQLFFPNGQV